MFRIEYDLQSFLYNLEDLEDNRQLGNWTFHLVSDGNEDFIELELDNSRFKDAGFFEVAEDRHYLEFRFFFNDRDGEEDPVEDEEIFSFYYGKLLQLILSKIIKNGEQIRVFK